MKSRTSSASLGTVAREWLRLGFLGFGGPPAHIALLRRSCVDEHKWMASNEFQDAVAATNLLPGPASTQLSIFCAWRVRGLVGGLLGGLCFIVPGLLIIIGLSVVLLSHHPPLWVLGAADGAGGAVPAVALLAASKLVPASRERLGSSSFQRGRWFFYALAGALCATLAGPFVVIALAACGASEVVLRTTSGARSHHLFIPAIVAPGLGLAGLGALTWVAFKIGALSYGGGFVIIPLMQHDVVTTYHWMSGTQFLYAVALGQLTPGPVVLTIAVVGYAVAGVGGALLATLVAFGPSFAFVLGGASRFDRLRQNSVATSFLIGAGPCVIGAIAGSAIPLGLLLQQWWQVAILAGALIWLFVLRRGTVSGLLLGAALGVLLALIGLNV